jgi:hypothetical protein
MRNNRKLLLKRLGAALAVAVLLLTIIGAVVTLVTDKEEADRAGGAKGGRPQVRHVEQGDLRHPDRDVKP